MNEPLTWAIVGASDIAATRMIPAIRSIGDNVAVVISGNESHSIAYAAANKIPRTSTKLQAALDETVDAVYISNSNERHYGDALTAIRAGKHVLCEKPMTMTLDDARQLVREAADAGVQLAVNHHLPGSPLHVAARELVADGAIGRVLSACVHHAVKLPERLRGWRISDHAGGGVVLDITCHDASVLNPILGRPLRVTALAVAQGDWGGDVLDAVMTVIEYEGNHGERIIAQTHDAFTVGYSSTSLEIQGTNGSIRILDAMTQDAAGAVILTTHDGERQVEVDTSQDLYVIVLEGFHAAIANRGHATATGADGLLALAVALAANESITTSATVSLTHYGSSE